MPVSVSHVSRLRAEARFKVRLYLFTLIKIAVCVAASKKHEGGLGDISLMNRDAGSRLQFGVL